MLLCSIHNNLPHDTCLCVLLHAFHPFTLLATNITGPSSQEDIQLGLSVHMSRLPAQLQARIASVQVTCLGPPAGGGGSLPAPHPETSLVAALQHTAAAAAPSLPVLHQVSGSALLQALTLLELRAKLAAAAAQAAGGVGVVSNGSSRFAAGLFGRPADDVGVPPDVLTAFVEAHNTGLLSLANCLEAQLDRPAAAWGYPPPTSSSSRSGSDSVWSTTQHMLQGVAQLQLPAPPPLAHNLLEQQQQQQHYGSSNSTNPGAAAIAQLSSYLDSLAAASAADGASFGGRLVSPGVSSAAAGVKSMLASRLVQQKQLLLAPPTATTGAAARGHVERQLQLVRTHCELLLQRLQQQALLQVVLYIDAADLALIVQADEQQQLEQQQLDNGGGGVVEDGALASPSSRALGTPIPGWPSSAEEEAEDAAGLERSSASPDALCSTAKKQAAAAAELLAMCRLKPWAGG